MTSITFIRAIIRPFLISFTFFFVYNASAQELSTIQATGIALPTDFKIDGTAGEWGSQLFPYNRQLSIYYQLANDKENLYLITVSKDPVITKKILGGGITISVATDNADQMTYITIPVLDEQIQSELSLTLNEFSLLPSDELRRKRLSDSLMLVLNKNFNEHSKSIKTKNLNGLPDTSISIYNVQKIRTKSAFDTKGNFTSEIIVPLKFIIKQDNITSLNYRIVLNGTTATNKNIYHQTNRGTVTVSTVPRGMINASTVSNLQVLSYPTDFSGTYNLYR